VHIDMSNLRKISIPKKTGSTFIIPFLLILLLIGGGLIYYIYYLRDTIPPTIIWKNPVEVMGEKGRLEIEISDPDWGIAEIMVTLQSAGEKSITLFQESLHPPLKKKNLTLPIDTKKLNEGKIKLLIEAFDKPSVDILSPNRGISSATFSLDLTPPRLIPITGLIYLQRGGSQMVVFQVSEDTISSGVRFNGHEYKGFTAIFPDKPQTGVVFFPFPATVTPKQYPVLFARDHVGNETMAELNVKLKNKNFRTREINISDNFLDRKMPVLAQTNNIPGKTNLEIYLYANRTTREQNAKEIMQICQNSVPEMLWDGQFHQLSNSKVESRFADHRLYYYKGKKVDEQDHLGVDLAVTRHYPVEAAARGMVVFEGNLGIYGNTVILDHGFGIFTLYGHLSMIEVLKGEIVEKKEPIGKTGKTGLAGGDHLHFAVLLHGTAVNPLEWWDRKWIQNTVTHKLRGLLPQKSNEKTIEEE
jgi:murein DD-endopeptidase MepM/ murein hydrolase activator NlpD